MKLKELFSKKKPAQQQMPAVTSELSVIEAAEKAADIVNTGVQNNDFAGVVEQISALGYDEPGKETLVFPAPSTEWRWPILALFAILTLGFLYMLLVSVSTALFSSSYRLTAVIGAVVSAAVLVLHVVALRRMLAYVKLCARYEKYRGLMQYRTIEVIEDVAGMAELPTAQVQKDLQSAVKHCWIPEGHFGLKEQILILSNESYERYLKDQAAYDRYYTLLIEEHRRITERPPEVASLMEIGEQYLDTIKKSDDLIQDREISDTLVRMHRIVSSIFREVDLNPDLAEQMGTLLNYYLPATEKLLHHYIEIMDKPVQGKSIHAIKREVADSLKMLVQTYEQLLDRFFRERELAVTGDIAALNYLIEMERESE